MQNSLSSPRSMVMLLDFEKIFFVLSPAGVQTYGKVRKTEKDSEIHCIKYRAHEYITALISDLSIDINDIFSIRAINKTIFYNTI